MYVKRLFGAWLVAGLALGSCAVGGKAAPPSAVLEDDQPSATQVETTIAEAAMTTPSAGCVVGSWELNSPLFVETLRETMAAEYDSATIEHAGGSYTIVLRADGSVDANRDGWMISASSSLGKVLQTVDSEESGTYAIDENAGSIALQLDQTSPPTVTFQTDSNGTLRPLSPQAWHVELPPEALIPSGAFSCTDEHLVITNQLGLVSEFTRR